MGKIRTAVQLQAILDGAISWRLQELAELKRLVRLSSGNTQAVLIRAAVPLAYAHWEGYVKEAATCYSSYLSSQSLVFRDIQPCFLGLVSLSLVQRMGKIRSKIFTASMLIGQLIAIEDQPVHIPIGGHIQSIGNLSYDRFQEVLEFLGLSSSWYQIQQKFIDETLLSGRNRIAHGEFLLFDVPAIETMLDRVIAITRTFKNDIENSVVTESFRRR